MTSESQVQLRPEDRAELEGWVAGRNTLSLDLHVVVDKLRNPQA